MERLVLTEEHLDGMHVLTVRGELDLSTVPKLCHRMARLREHGNPPLAVIDLTYLEFCDSTGLRALLGEAREAEICGGHLRIVAPMGGVARRLFDVCGVDHLLDVDPDCSTALRELSAV